MRKIIMASLLAAAYMVLSCSHLDRDTLTGTVTEKTVKRMDKDSGDKYLVFVKLDDGRSAVFENTDSLIEGKFRSADLYGSLKVGKRYRFHVYGWRNGCLSWYKNIKKAEPLPPLKK